MLIAKSKLQFCDDVSELEAYPNTIQWLQIVGFTDSTLRVSCLVHDCVQYCRWLLSCFLLPLLFCRQSMPIFSLLLVVSCKCRKLSHKPRDVIGQSVACGYESVCYFIDLLNCLINSLFVALLSFVRYRLRDWSVIGPKITWSLPAVSLQILGQDDIYNSTDLAWWLCSTRLLWI